MKSGALPRLTSLELGMNPLSTFSLESGALPRLTSLALSGANLTSLPPDIKYLTTLLYLDLENNRLTDLSSDIGCLNNLKTLSLKGNRIAMLPAEIVRMADLRRLDFSFNPLVMYLAPRTLPENLTDLSLDATQFHLLHPEISQREKLCVWRVGSSGVSQSGFNPYDPNKALEAIWGPICDAAQEAGLSNIMPPTAAIIRNWLQSHPEQVEAITSLNLSRKGLHCLPKEIGLFTGLRSLSLANNKLSLLPPQMGQLVQCRDARSQFQSTLCTSAGI